MKFLLLITVVLVSSCIDTPQAPYIAEEKPLKWCIDKCIKNTFRMFNNGQFLGGSSSMNGISEVNIFDKIHNYCANYYKDKCYENLRNPTHGLASDTDNVDR